MMKGLVSLIMLLSLITVTISPTLAAASDSAEHKVSAELHMDGTPCPDDESHGPCEEGCPCLCCPGHSTAAVLSLSRPFVAASRVLSRTFGNFESFVPDGKYSRIYRPPRV